MELLQNQLREIISGKRYLIVLDDVWNENSNQWDVLKMLLDCGGEGSAVVISTRSTIAAKVMATHTIHDLKQLPDEDSWELFRRRAFAQRAEEPANLVKIGKDIIKRCGGLPLAIATLGSMMRLEDDEEKWKAVLGSEIWEMQAAKDNILPALRLSYNYLPSHLKQCFAFCAIYPKDYEMKKDEMIQLWMANGFIPSDGKGDLDAVGRDIFDDLVWRSFFQNVEDSREIIFTRRGIKDQYSYKGILKFKIHDLMHDLAQSIMGKECFNFRYVFKIHGQQIPPKHCLMNSLSDLSPFDQSIFPKVRTIIKWQYYSDPIKSSSKFTSMFKAIRVLSWNLDNLRVGHLRHLRMLNLSYSDIQELPKGICSLYNLQTLNLTDCFELKKLPDNLADLVNLRHLYIDGCFKLICMPRGMRRLKQLQTLTKYIVGVESERGIEQLRDMNLSGTLHLLNIEKVSNAFKAEDLSLSSKKNLHSIILSWEGVGSPEVFEALKPYDKLRMLGVHKYKGHQFPKWMNDPEQLQNLVHVTLVGCENCKELPPLEQLPFLEFLNLDGMDEVKHIISKTIWRNGELHTTLFPSLKALHMSSMKNLEGWWELEESRQLFPFLTHLLIESCNNLKAVPAMPSLQDLRVSSCNSNLTNMCLFASYEWANHSQLRKLHLFDCRDLIHFSTRLPSICTLIIENCNILESLSGLGRLVRLQELELRNCNVLVSLPEGMKSLISLDIVQCNGLTSLPKDLIKLHKLGLNSCDGLVSLPVGMEGLCQLKDLSIINCERLTSLPEGLLLQLPNLTRLEIIGHDELIRPFQSGGDYWYLIEKIPLRDIKHCTTT